MTMHALTERARHAALAHSPAECSGMLRDCPFCYAPRTQPTDARTSRYALAPIPHVRPAS